MGLERSRVFLKLATALLEQASIGPTSSLFELGMVISGWMCRAEWQFQLPILSLFPRRKPQGREITLPFFSRGLCSRHVEVSVISKAGLRLLRLGTLASKWGRGELLRSTRSPSLRFFARGFGISFAGRRFETSIPSGDRYPALDVSREFASLQGERFLFPLD